MFGPGAGAASAGLLAVMPRSRSMVRRVIAMSGSPLADWASIDDKFRAMNTSLVFGERVGCTIENSWKLVGCVRRGREDEADAVQQCCMLPTFQASFSFIFLDCFSTGKVHSITHQEKCELEGS